MRLAGDPASPARTPGTGVHGVTEGLTLSVACAEDITVDGTHRTAPSRWTYWVRTTDRATLHTSTVHRSVLTHTNTAGVSSRRYKLLSILEVSVEVLTSPTGGAAVTGADLGVATGHYGTAVHGGLPTPHFTTLTMTRLAGLVGVWECCQLLVVSALKRAFLTDRTALPRHLHRVGAGWRGTRHTVRQHLAVQTPQYGTPAS